MSRGLHIRTAAAMGLALLFALAVQLMPGASACREPLASSAVTHDQDSSIVVTSAADAGPATLRQALLDARGGDTITFDPAAFPPTRPVTIALTSGLPGIQQGDLTIDASNAEVILDGSHIGITPETLLLDDISLTLDGGPNLIANGDFTAGLGHWRPWDEASGATRTLNRSDYHSSPQSYDWSSVAQTGESRIVYDITDTSAAFDCWCRYSPFDSPASTTWISVTAGSTIHLRFWYRYGPVSARLHALFADAHSEQAGEWWFEQRSGWTEAVASQAAPADARAIALEFGFNHSEYSTVGLSVASSGNTIRGLQIVGFPGAGMTLFEVANSNVIGGDRHAGRGPLGQGNLISRNGNRGIILSNVSFNTIVSNYIGTDLGGSVAWGNRWEGIIMGQASHNQVMGNVISANSACGGGGMSVCDDSSDNTISGNYIGADPSGTVAVGNHGYGIGLYHGPSHNTIGPDNVIAYNDGDGVRVSNAGSVGNTITRNSMHDNAGMGISLDSGGNRELVAPVVLDVDLVSGIVTGTACANCTVELFSGAETCSTGGVHGKVYEGRTIVDGTGAFSFRKGAPLSGPRLTATATDAEGNTSEFSTGDSVVPRLAAVKGERYEAVVPDTLDLAERARLAINGMTRCTDPESVYSMYFFVQLFRNPPVMFTLEGAPGANCVDGLLQMRMITGSRLNEHVDQHWWAAYFHNAIDSRAMFDAGRQWARLAMEYRLSRDPCLRQVGDEALGRLWQAMVHRDDYGYLPDDRGAMPTGWEAGTHGWLLTMVNEFYLATGSSAARAVAAELARYLKDHAQIFDSQGRFLSCHKWVIGPCVHFHNNAENLVAMSEYAAATGDENIAAFAKLGYEWARSLGSPLVGFFPEYVTQPDNPRNVNEPCATNDMILLALNLTQAGQGDYWDDVDRYVRNQFAETQITSSDWIDRIVAALPPTPVEPDRTALDDSTRLVGCFLGWATANDIYRPDDGIQNCCLSSGVHALYYVWERMIEFKNRTLRINLLLNRASPWADVDSYIPYEGRVDVRIKQTCSLEIRIPEWVQPQDTLCTVNGTPRLLTFHGRYAQVGQVQGGDKVALTFPISERTVQTTIGDMPCTLIIKGNDVVSIDPPGKWCPFYQRAQYRENQVRWVTRERFVLTQYNYVFLPIIFKGYAG